VIADPAPTISFIYLFAVSTPTGRSPRIKSIVSDHHGSPGAYSCPIPNSRAASYWEDRKPERSTGSLGNAAVDTLDVPIDRMEGGIGIRHCFAWGNPLYPGIVRDWSDEGF
jgi:hypothetical protein